ncbi:MAG TPA: UDP-N-acetylmuramoyl-L-alanine--D-glutamate ligase [Candidatus Dormibacteraeota bacterium]|nr:UDP-N-acetylmuramoyl-L-alanine--D-glutamate ligase [Candidatus Dormibacteraeota bacterium]
MELTGNVNLPGQFDLQGQRVLVVGLARTGVATALFCAAHGARVTATDAQSADRLSDALKKLQPAGVACDVGAHSQEIFLEQDLIVVSPGVPADAAPLLAARAKGITIWSEIELASRFLRGKLIGITGSNGKTTTTSLVAHILRSAGFPAILAGNIGTPLIACVEDSRENTWTVTELSSFQLELTDTFRPDISAFLNLTPDHLDRHRTMEAYGAAKAKIFANQSATDCAVLNADDAATVPHAPKGPALYWFSRKEAVKQGAFLRDGEIVFRREGREQSILRVKDIPLVGAHNLENVLAAVVITLLAGAQAEAVASAVKTFTGVDHRLEFVAEIGGVQYYNDSKATNVDATQKALESFDGRIIVILGGKDKDSDYRTLRKDLRERVVRALLIGAAAEKIASHVAGSVDVEMVGTLERAVVRAEQIARSGDTVLLAPACASFDQFENYEHRGRVFKDLVHKLAERAAVSQSAAPLPAGK